MKKSLICLILGMLITTSFSQIVLKSACDPWPPFVDPQNPQEGLSLEIARAAFATQGYKISHEYLPWARAMKYLKEGRIDIIVDTWMSESRKKFLAFSDPYAVNAVKFIKLRYDDFEFNDYKSLDGKVVGIIRDYGYSDKFHGAKNFKTQTVSNLYQNVKKLVAGRIDLTLSDEIVAKMSIAQKDESLLEKISFTKNSISENNLHVTSGKANPKHKEIIAAFNKGLKKIKLNGTYAEIMKKYGIEVK